MTRMRRLRPDSRALPPAGGTLLRAIPLALALLLAAGCSDGATAVEQDATRLVEESRDTAAQAPEAATARTQDGGDLLLDLRLPESGFTADAGETRRIVEAVYGQGAPEDLALTARVQGAFTAPGARQTAYVLQRESARVPHGLEAARPMLAVLGEDGRVAAQFVQDYERIAAVADVDGDGIDEVFMRADGYHMGQSYAGIELVSLAGGQRQVLAQYPEAWLDACANPAGERYVEAGVIVRGEAGPELRRYRAGCGDGPPAPDDFSPVFGERAPGT